MKRYSIALKTRNYVDYQKEYIKAVRYWRECGGTHRLGIFSGDDATLAQFYLTFIDDNLIITFSEINTVVINKKVLQNV